jgi:hypothetical protein
VITDVSSEVNPDVIVLCHGGLSLWFLPSFILFICYTLFSILRAVMTMGAGRNDFLRMCKGLGIMVTCETECKYFYPR